MKRLLFVLAVLVLSASAVFADVTVAVSVSVQTANMTQDGTMTSYVKGTKFLVDTSMAGQNMSLLSDAAAKQQWMINHTTRQIEPFDPNKAMANLPIAFGDAKASVTPNGQTKEILGKRCEGYQVDITIPMTIGGETIVMKMSGPTWTTKEGAAVAEFRAAQKAFNDIGMTTSMLAQGPQGKAMAELNKALGDSGVIMEQNQKMTMEGTGQMAQMMGQMGQMTVTIKVTSIATDAIPDTKFALPEGYTKK